MQDKTFSKRGYYTVSIEAGNEKIPYTVFALSDYHAARLVREETGYLARPHEIEGPHPNRCFFTAIATGSDLR